MSRNRTRREDENMKGQILLGIIALTLLATAGTASAAQPKADNDCSTTVTDPDLGTGTRAELYNCHPIRNNGEEAGRYWIYGASAESLGYPAEYGTCDVLVVWSGDFGGTPYLDFGRVYNLAKCTNGFLEVWGDRFSATDPWAATPYVWNQKGVGSLIHPD